MQLTKQCAACEADVPEERRSDAVYCSHACGRRTRSKRHYLNNPEKVAANRAKQNSDAARRILSRANLLKNNATSAELELVLADLRASGQ